MKIGDISKCLREFSAPKRQGTRRDYDVMIKLNGGGKERTYLNFLLYREAREAFKDVDRLEVTSVEALPERIYFIPRTEKARGNYKLNRKSGVSFLMTPKGKEEKIYRLKWINKKFELRYDEECGLYYIEIEK